MGSTRYINYIKIALLIKKGIIIAKTNNIIKEIKYNDKITFESRPNKN